MRNPSKHATRGPYNRRTHKHQAKQYCTAQHAIDIIRLVSDSWLLNSLERHLGSNPAGQRLGETRAMRYCDPGGGLCGLIFLIPGLRLRVVLSAQISGWRGAGLPAQGWTFVASSFRCLLSNNSNTNDRNNHSNGKNSNHDNDNNSNNSSNNSTNGKNNNHDNDNTSNNDNNSSNSNTINMR